jgi:hypothetical protein
VCIAALFQEISCLKKGCALFHTTKMFQRRPGLRAAVWTMVPWPWRNPGADAKSHRKKLVLLAPIMRGDKTKGILATVQWSAAKKIRSWLVRQKDVEESLPSGPYRVDLLWNPN